jgi:hypothetical protein
MPKKAPPKKEGFVRTSVFLPPTILGRLGELTPNQSEGIRLALERYFYIRDSAFAWTEDLTDRYGELLCLALAEYDETDYKTIARVLPELVESFISENSVYDPVSHQALDAAKELKELNVPARIAVLDWVVAQRLDEQ